MGVVCPKNDSLLTAPFANCTICQVSVKTLVDTASKTGVSLSFTVLTQNTSGVTAGQRALNASVAAGDSLKKLNATGGQWAKLTAVTLSFAAPWLSLSASVASVASAAKGTVVQVYSDATLTLGALGGYSYNWAAFSARVPALSDVLNAITATPAVAGGLKASDLATGFAACQLTLDPADDKKPLAVNLVYTGIRRRRLLGTGPLCALNKVGALATDACKCPAMPCSGAVTCTTNAAGGPTVANTGTWVVQSASSALCPAAASATTTTAAGNSSTPKPTLSAQPPPARPPLAAGLMGAMAALLALLLPLATA